MHRTTDRSRFHAVPRVLDACFDVGGAELHLLTTVDGRRHQRCIANRTEEIDLLLTWLTGRAKLEGFSNVRVVVEPTGVYHELLFRMARMRGMETCLVSAEAASKNRVVLFGDTGKTDKRDPVAIADLAARDIVIRDRDLSDDFSALRFAGALYARAEKSGIRAKNQIHRAMRRLFPDFDFSPSFLFGHSGRAVFQCTGFDRNESSVRVRTPKQSGQCFEVMRTAFRRNADSNSKLCGHFGGFVVMVSAMARGGVRIRSAECPHSVGIENR